jgi:hypothetical protein
MSRDEVSDQNKHGHDNMLSDRLNVGASDFKDSNVSGVGGI